MESDDAMLNPMFRLLSRGKLSVLMFHKVPAAVDPLVPGDLSLEGFERVMDAVSQWFQVLPLDEALLGLRAGNLPGNALCITFDDGYADWLSGVVPSLERRGLHATFYVTSGQFSGQPLWHERILHAVRGAPASLERLHLSASDLPDLLLSGVESRSHTIARLDRHLKYQTSLAREGLLREIEHQTAADPGGVPRMSIDDLRAIHSKGFGIGGHSVTHPILAHCSPDEAYQEIALAREELEGMVRGQVTSFAYPNGLPATDFTADHVAMVQRAGYRSAMTTHWGVANSQTPVFQVPRFTPWGPTSGRMAWQLARNYFHAPKLVVGAPGPEQKVLMVAFHFPPQAGSSGILRTLNFVKNLGGLGWSPTVLSAHPKAYVEQRNDLVPQIPQDTPVHRPFALDAARHLSIAGKYPRYFALPDRWSSWWPAAVLRGRKLIRDERPAVIWSTYPIASAHWIASSLARSSGLPWVADFRDPMVSDGYPVDKTQRRIWRSIETRALQQASACVFTTERAAATYAQRYPASAGKCIVIENGYDEDAFEGLTARRNGVAGDVLLMLHSGLIYPQDRNPSTFFEAVNALLQSGRLDRSRLCIRFRAPHHGEEVLAFAAQQGLSDVVDVAPPVPYREAIAEMLAADLLVVFQGSNFNAQIPAKIYEYLRAQRPLLAVLDPSGDTATQLRQFDGVLLGDIASAEALKDSLHEWLDVRETPAAAQAFADNLIKVRRYSRRAHAVRLAELLSRVAAQSR
jgi:peptidoglycan/xylan/chitin deacetylase (PgdA/CDA1 family)/glycosyltransferase involved in cell wall biosynthesis